jgi:hypothetical protein
MSTTTTHGIYTKRVGKKHPKTDFLQMGTLASVYLPEGFSRVWPPTRHAISQFLVRRYLYTIAMNINSTDIIATQKI